MTRFPSPKKDDDDDDHHHHAIRTALKLFIAVLWLVKELAKPKPAL